MRYTVEFISYWSSPIPGMWYNPPVLGVFDDLDSAKEAVEKAYPGVSWEAYAHKQTGQRVWAGARRAPGPSERLEGGLEEFRILEFEPNVLTRGQS
jgi:hypothetical protein